MNDVELMVFFILFRFGGFRYFKYHDKGECVYISETHFPAFGSLCLFRRTGEVRAFPILFRNCSFSNFIFYNQPLSAIVTVFLKRNSLLA